MDFGFPDGKFDARFFLQVLPFLLLDLVLRGISLWRSAQRKQKWWFVALLIVNSVGILPAIYLLINRKKSDKTSTKK